MTDKLKPCPFCGGEHLTYRAAHIGDSYYCEGCGSYGPLSNPDNIKEAYNTRPTVRPVVKKLEFVFYGANMLKVKTPFGTYILGDRSWWFEDENSHQARDIEAAKAAAQADHERRILSCLEGTPPTHMTQT